MVHDALLPEKGDVMATRVKVTTRNVHGNLVKLKTGESIRKDGMMLFRYTDRSGRRRYIYASTIEKLREKEKSLQKDMLIGLKPETRTKTLNEVFDEWIELKRGIREDTMHNYLYRYNQYIRESIGKKRIKELSHGEVRRFYNRLLDYRGLRVVTIDGVHKLLQQICDYSVKQRYIQINPCNGAMRELKATHSTNGQRHRALSAEEQSRFLDFMLNSSKYKQWYPIFAFMVGTGLRAGEVTGLRWCDISDDSIDVNHTLVHFKDDTTGGMVLHINPPKTKSGRRVIPMTESVKRVLEMERENQRKQNISCNITVDGYTDFVFLSSVGRIRYLEVMNRTLRNIVRDANYDAQDRNDGTVLLPTFSCHNLRSTFCTRLAESGTPIPVTMRLMGHSDVKTTIGVYTSVDIEWERKELSTLEKNNKDSHKNGRCTTAPNTAPNMREYA